METVKIQTEYIKLDSFLKLTGLVDTGGQAKAAVQEGMVKVNGEACTQRGKKLRDGDRVELAGREFTVSAGLEE